MSLSKNEIKFIRSLQQKKNRDSEGLFLVEGVKLIEELVDQEKFKIHSIYSTGETELKFNPNTEIKLISNKDLERISGFKTPNQVLAIVYKPQIQEIDFVTENLTIGLDDIKDPGNLGTIIRTADWFGINQIICSEQSVDVYNPKVVQSTMGAIFRVNVVYQSLKICIERFRNNDFDVLTGEMNGEDALAKKYQQKSVVIMGSESHGISDEIGQLCQPISIPSYGKTESLNVAMATGIICSAYAKLIK